MIVTGVMSGGVSGPAAAPPAPRPAASIAALVLGVLDGAADRPAICDALGGGRTWSWGEVTAAAAGLAAEFAAAGVARGERLAHLGPHSPDWIVVDLACALAGVVHCGLHADAPAADDPPRRGRPEARNGDVSVIGRGHGGIGPDRRGPVETASIRPSSIDAMRSANE